MCIILICMYIYTMLCSYIYISYIHTYIYNSCILYSIQIYHSRCNSISWMFPIFTFNQKQAVTTRRDSNAQLPQLSKRRWVKVRISKWLCLRMCETAQWQWYIYNTIYIYMYTHTYIYTHNTYTWLTCHLSHGISQRLCCRHSHLGSAAMYIVQWTLQISVVFARKMSYALVNVNKKLWKITILQLGKSTINCHFQWLC